MKINAITLNNYKNQNNISYKGNDSKKSVNISVGKEDIPNVATVAGAISILGMIIPSYGKLAKSTLKYKIGFVSVALALSTLAATGIMTIYKTAKNIISNKEEQQQQNKV